MSKHFYTIILALVASVGQIFAYDAEIDGLYYNLNTIEQTASVTYKSYSHAGVVVCYEGCYYNEGWNITEANIPSSISYNGKTYSVTSIGVSAFNDCTGLTSVTIPNSVTSIGKYAFEDCTGLTSVIIPNSVTTIAEQTFSGCTGLTSINIPNSITWIGEGAFWGCTGMKEVHISDIAAWCAITYGYEFTTSASNPLYYAHHLYLNDSEITNLVIPDGITKINEIAFPNCTGLTSITIPNSVTGIGREAFEGCTSLTSIEIPNFVTGIGNEAFKNCTGLTSVTIPNSVAWIGNEAFGDCTGLTSISIEANTPPYLSCMTEPLGFFPNTNNCPIYVPCGTLSKYKNDYYWGRFHGDRLMYAPLPTLSINCNETEGKVTKQGAETICDDEPIIITATPNTGYHFTQWSDGDINNPRTVQLTQDTAFTAEFAKNVYTITAVSNNPEYGYTLGGRKAEYMESVELTAVPQIGHHFNYWQCGSNYYTNNPVTVVVQGDATYTALFGPDIYDLTVNANPSQGYVTAPDQAEFLQEVTMTATPLNGYEFVQWNDGVKDNPRYIQLTQDTAFTAEFAKAQYTIATAVNETERGTAEGDKVVEYLASVTLTATANQGYHFDHWQSGTKTYTANPLTVTATGSATYTAYFVPNTYSVNAYSDNTSWGSVSAPSQADYLDWITLTANPVKGAVFVQWSDGNKENSRYIQIVQDTILSAEFAILTSGRYCADVLWHFSNNTLHIVGFGDMYGECEDSWELLIPQIQKVEIGEKITHVIPAEMGKLYNLSSVKWNATNYTAPSSESDAPFYSRRNQISDFVFGKQVKKVPAYLCYEMAGLTEITLGSNVTNIGKHAFDGCEDLAAITCEATTPPNCGMDAFSGVSIFIPVYVPLSSIEKYAKAPIWKDFDAFSSIQAETTSVTEVKATASENSVVLEWPANDEADIYSVVIMRGDAIFCTLSFNAQGQLLGIQFVRGRNGAHHSTAAQQTVTGWQFTITSLEAGTTYDYTVTAKKADNTAVYTQSGVFTTTGTATGIDAIVGSDSAPVKVMRDGQLYILREGKMYSVQGQEVR